MFGFFTCRVLSGTVKLFPHLAIVSPFPLSGLPSQIHRFCTRTSDAMLKRSPELASVLLSCFSWCTQGRYACYDLFFTSVKQNSVCVCVGGGGGSAQACCSEPVRDRSDHP